MSVLFAAWSLLVPSAHAESPDLTGVHAALGAHLAATLGPNLIASPASPSLEGNVRLFFGPVVLLEVAAWGGLRRSDDLYETQQLSDAAEVEVDYHDSSVMRGWAAGGGLRCSFRLHDGPIAFYLGAGATYGAMAVAGPWFHTVEDPEGGAPTVQLVGEAQERRREWGADVSAKGMHWVTDRLAVTAELSVPVIGRDVHIEDEVQTAGPVKHVQHGDWTAGVWPEVGLSVHLRL